jgi:hypothetical protein
MQNTIAALRHAMPDSLRKRIYPRTLFVNLLFQHFLHAFSSRRITMLLSFGRNRAGAESSSLYPFPE